MRMSCNGCRILRKGCSQDCILKPCIQWLTSPESQANATLFLAKFYGRAGLVNLINAGPPHLHQEIFKSLLYEACGRIINPVHGAIGLMNSGDWERCQAAVDAVLQGSPVMMQATRDDDFDLAQELHPVQACDIRHIYRGAAADLHRVKMTNRFKRTSPGKNLEKLTLPRFQLIRNHSCFLPEAKRFPIPDDSSSIETSPPALLRPPPQALQFKAEAPPCDIGLELTLGPNQFIQAYISASV